mgnify:CR=1 FL=1
MRTIRVTGKGQIKVKPDITRITMTLTGVFKEYGETLRHSSEDTEALKDVLSAFGFERSDLKTLSFHVDTEYESYRDKNNDYKRRFVGYQFNHWLYLGGGVGFEGISHVWCSGIIMTIPVFADVRAYMTGTKVKPFFDVQLGYKISCNSKTDDSYRYSGHFKLGGLHASIGFGIEYKRLSVKLAYNLACIQEKGYKYSKYEPKNKSAFYVGLGVNF